MVLLAIISAVLSAFLDNVTTVLLIVPVTFSITDRLKISPFPFFVTEIIASNVGGTATLIGDPPNILIGSATQLSFMDFILNLSPIILIILPVTVLFMMMVFRKSLQAAPEARAKIMELDEIAALRNRVI
jgi:Na+/H+ antiporter NhaD/arsenite permease-like protein